MDYTQKYLKYKQKYMALKQYAIQRGGNQPQDFIEYLNNKVEKNIPNIQHFNQPIPDNMIERRNIQINEQKNKLQEQINHLLEQGVAMPDNNVKQLIILTSQLNMIVGANMQQEDKQALINDFEAKIAELHELGIVIPDDPRISQLVFLMLNKEHLNNGMQIVA
jgi:hypothetical protein